MIMHSPLLSLILFAVVLLGARKIFKAVTSFTQGLFKSMSPQRVRHVAFTVIGLSIMVMAAPLLIPFGGPFRLVVMLVYMLYAGCGLWQVFSLFYGRDDTNKTK